MPASSDALIQITEAAHDVAIDMVYARADNFTGRVIYAHGLCFLHPAAEAALRRAARAARGFGLQLKIFDAFRPQEAQEALWAFLPDPDYVVNPAEGSNHTRGVAVDVTLVDGAGQELDMGTAVDTMTPASHHFHAGLAATVQLNRMRLMAVMLEAGFVHYPHEWWHYQLPDAGRFPLLGGAAVSACSACSAAVA
ncbi:MAG: peptidase vanX D-ala-D-ala dipeptidase [Polaromonas sp.]|nr:peptidase vanX D-ala-D-ala dipeptidase [Polaromonas sp.]